MTFLPLLKFLAVPLILTYLIYILLLLNFRLAISSKNPGCNILHVITDFRSYADHVVVVCIALTASLLTTL